jgi:hypothetical protein
VRKLSSELAEYKAESKAIRNQDLTIRKLVGHTAGFGGRPRDGDAAESTSLGRQGRRGRPLAALSVAPRIVGCLRRHRLPVESMMFGPAKGALVTAEPTACH